MMRERIKNLAGQLARSRVARDSSVLLVANWTSTGLSIITSIILTHLLGKDGYGRIVIAIAVINTITQFMDIRTGEGMIRFMGNALARGEKREAITFFYVGLTADALLMLATLVLAAILAPAAVQVSPERAALAPLVLIYLWTIPFALLEESFSSVLNVFKRFNLLAIGTIANGLILLVALVGMSAYGLAGVMWGYVIAAACSFVIWGVMGTALILRHIGTLRGADYRGAWQRFLPFAFHTSLTQSIKAIMVNLDILLLGALRPPGDAAIFRIAHSATSLITMPTSPVSAVIYPEMNEAWAVNQLDRVRRLVRQYMLATLAISSAVYAFLAVAGDFLVALLYPPDFAPAAALIRILGLGVVLESLFRWVRPATLACGRPQLTTFYSVAQILWRIAITVPFVYYLGATGAALSYVVVVVMTVLLIGFYVVPQMGLWSLFRRRST
jgi:O-antigen/teichoic acid export membrane protein